MGVEVVRKEKLNALESILGGRREAMKKVVLWVEHAEVGGKAWHS
jgi:hypothetical protein